jgi:hypothetical protein
MTWRNWWLTVALVLVAVGVLALPTPPDVWDNSYEAAPAASDPVGEGDDQIRALKNELRNRLEVEHKIGTQGGSPDNGLHLEGSARCFFQASAPTAIAVAEYNNTGGTANTTLTSTEANGSQTIGEGRCWIDSNSVLWYHNSAGFVQSKPLSTRNLIPNNVFSGQDSSSTSAPAGGWTVLGATTPTIAYVAKAAGEGAGLALRTTASGAVNEGVQVILSGLRASATYYLAARVSSAAGDTCTARFNASGATDVTATNTGTGAVEIIGVLATTDGTPTAEIIELEADASGDICDWQSVALYEASTPHASPHGDVLVSVDSSTTGAAVGALPHTVSGVEVASVVPGSNYYIKVTGHGTISCGNGDSVDYELSQSINGGATTACASGYFNSSGGEDSATPTLTCIVETPTVGSEYAYTWVYTSESGNCHVNELLAGTDHGETRVVLEMIPRG